MAQEYLGRSNIIADFEERRSGGGGSGQAERGGGSASPGGVTESHRTRVPVDLPADAKLWCSRRR